MKPKQHRGMIVRGSDLDFMPDGYCSDVQVDHNPAYRISEVLGPDGNPPLVGYERPAVGFDLRPKK